MSVKSDVKKKFNRIIMNESEFREWVYDTSLSAYRFLDNPKYVYGSSNGTTYIINTANGTTAFAYCQKSDKFDMNIGISLAFARYMNRPIPLIVDKVRFVDLKVGDVILCPDNNLHTFCGLEKTGDIEHPYKVRYTKDKKLGEYECLIDCLSLHVTCEDTTYRVVK